MRGLAACWVLVHHANLSVIAFTPSSSGQSTWISNGYLGVDFFFVLSGFIIAYSSHRLLESGRGFTDYAKARLIRIYVPYLPVGVGMVLLYMILPQLSASDRAPGLLTSFTLLPSNSPPALSVAWTLVHEIIFYAFFSLIFVSRVALWTLMASWAVVIVCYAWVGQPMGRGLEYLLSPLNLNFLLGVVVYYLTRKGVATWIAVSAALASASVVFVVASQQHPNRWLVALAFAGATVAASSPWAQRRTIWSWLLVLGAASYSIYLIHNPVLSFAVRGFRHIATGAGSLSTFLVISLVALVAGLAYFHLYERHALAIVKRHLFAKKTDRTPTRVNSVDATHPENFN